VVAALVVVLVGVCAITIVIFATRMGLSVHSHVIELLHLIGALDSYVARQFQAHALKMSLRGGLVGLILAVLSVLLVDRALQGADVPLLPVLPIRGLEVALLALLPVLVAMVAMLTARLTVLRTLGRMP
jgi:cell division transport system permease protein